MVSVVGMLWGQYWYDACKFVDYGAIRIVEVGFSVEQSFVLGTDTLH